jgi:ABC-type oligopeptide transport system ATPase subunit
VPAIEFENVSRTYKSRPGLFKRRTIEVQALTDVSFAVEEGGLFGLLGRMAPGRTRRSSS